MLVELWIRNLALVEEVRVVLGPGLTVLTGETGAGKSLIIGALDLALGARASADLVRRGAAEAEVAARFSLPPGRLTDPDVADEEGMLLLRRVVGRDGRSRAWVNDRPATVGRLRELGARLADLHGQHEQQNLLREETHLDYLDAYARHEPLRAAVAEAYAVHHDALAARDALVAASRRAAEEREFLDHQHRELTRAGLEEGEEDALRRERQRVAHVERLAEAAAEALAALTGDDAPAEGSLGRAARALEEAAALDDTLDPLRRQVDEALVAVEDAARELERYADRLEADPERLETIERRLETLAQLRRKYRMDVAALIARRDELTRLLDASADLPAEMDRLERAVAEAGERLLAEATALTRSRERAAGRLARDVSRELRGLGMPEARFRVALSPPPQGAVLPGRAAPIGPAGGEIAAFLLAANPGENEGRLAATASGGEMSRVMLALKTVLRRADPVPLAIFDEIDSGIGGLVAEQVAERLRAMAADRQVLVVTHLPVIAGRGDRHLRIAKATSGGRTGVSVRELAPEEREEELARMLAGRAGGDHARRTARSLLAGGSAEGSR